MTQDKTTRRPLDWYGPEDYDGYADPTDEIARVAAQQAEWDAAHMAFAAGGPTRLVPMWRGWISGFVAGAAAVGFIWSIM